MSIGSTKSGSDAGSFFDGIAHRYDRHRRPGGPHDEVLKRLTSEAGAKRVLEIGSGTGNSATAFVASYPCELVGLDLSSGMLRRAVEKGIDGCWVNGDAVRIPIADASIDFIYSVLAFHLIEDAAACLRECYRVLGSGICAIVTAPEDFIHSHLLNQYFPSFSAIDLARFQSERLLRDYMENAGFVDVEFAYCSKEPVPVDEQYLLKIENRFISTLALLPDDEFKSGLGRLREDIADTGQLDEPMIWQSVVVSGRKE